MGSYVLLERQNLEEMLGKLSQEEDVADSSNGSSQGDGYLVLLSCSSSLFLVFMIMFSCPMLLSTRTPRYYLASAFAFVCCPFRSYRVIFLPHVIIYPHLLPSPPPPFFAFHPSRRHRVLFLFVFFCLWQCLQFFYQYVCVYQKFDQAMYSTVEWTNLSVVMQRYDTHTLSFNSLHKHRLHTILRQ